MEQSLLVDSLMVGDLVVLEAIADWVELAAMVTVAMKVW